MYVCASKGPLFWAQPPCFAFPRYCLSSENSGSGTGTCQISRDLFIFLLSGLDASLLDQLRLHARACKCPNKLDAAVDLSSYKKGSDLKSKIVSTLKRVYALA